MRVLVGAYIKEFAPLVHAHHAVGGVKEDHGVVAQKRVVAPSMGNAERGWTLSFLAEHLNPRLRIGVALLRFA
jgi:hypothetical protein